MTRCRLLAAAFVSLPVAAQAAEVGGIRAHLFYEQSGRLSANVAPPAEFALWNTIIGEGDAEEPADDLLVMVELVGLGAEDAEPLRIVVRGDRGRVVARRTVPGPFLGESGSAWKALWLHDVGCAGRLEITATVGRSTRTAAIDLACGE